MAVRIGSARHDENGKISGGKAGDQTGEEVSRQAWYLHSKGWVCIRAKDPAVREKIARNMEYACDNQLIGYDQGQNYTLFDVAGNVGWDCSKVKKACETDCARLVRVCVWYAGIRCGDFYTGDEVDTLRMTGQFDILTAIKYTTTDKNLLRGDILVTKTKGHTVVVLDNGENIVEPIAVHETLRRNDKGDAVKELQRSLNHLGYHTADYEQLKLTGTYGSRTVSFVKQVQKESSLETDGICGDKTWAAIEDLKQKAGQVKVLTSLNCRAGAGTKYQVKTVLKKGAAYTATRTEGSWCYLAEPAGWVNSKYVSADI